MSIAPYWELLETYVLDRVSVVVQPQRIRDTVAHLMPHFGHQRQQRLFFLWMLLHQTGEGWTSSQAAADTPPPSRRLISMARNSG